MMLEDDCYRDLDIPFFDGDIIAKLSAFARSKIDSKDFIVYDDYKTPEEFADVMSAVPELNLLKEDCTIGFYPLLMFLPPNFSMAIHQDVHFLDNRKCNIGVIVHPDADIAPTKFYSGSEADTHMVSAPWRLGECKMLNIQHWHNVDNNGSWRANLQISLDRYYDEVIELIDQGKLFKNFSCDFTR